MGLSLRKRSADIHAPLDVSSPSTHRLIAATGSRCLFEETGR